MFRKISRRKPESANEDAQAVTFVVDEKTHVVKVTRARDAESNASLLFLALKKRLPLEHS